MRGTFTFACEMRFERLRPIGRGAFGTVYMYRDHMLGKTVAMKIVRLEVCKEPIETFQVFVGEGVVHIKHFMDAYIYIYISKLYMYVSKYINIYVW